MQRVTINEIAAAAGVSKGAVSYALNDRPGVSAATRARILDVAHTLGWTPNRAARMLSGSRRETFGLILARDPRTLASEPFYMEFLAGLQSELSGRAYGLLLQVAPDLDAELELYPRWAAEQRVDAVVVVDLRRDDPRIPLLREIALPAVLVGDPSLSDGFTTIWTDDEAAMGAAVDYLAGLGHRHVARIAGLPGLGHVRIRDAAFERAASVRGLRAPVVHADFSEAAGRQATRALVCAEQPPTALMFDNDLMAIAGLSALAELGLRVPEDVSVLAWDDSALCQITHPKLSAMNHDVVAFGAHVGRRTFDLLDGVEPAAHLDSTPTLVVRASTAAPR